MRNMERVKSYRRKGYRRKNGTYIHSSRVKSHYSRENKRILRQHINNILRLLEIDQREAERALKRLPIKERVKIIREIKKIEDRF